MSETSVPHPIITTKGYKLDFPDFDISWVGRDPSNSLLYFGSENGHIRIVSDLDPLRRFTHPFDSHGESINGIAFNGPWIAASTRCEVIFMKPSLEEGGRQPRIYDGGAHGVTASSAGGFVAPLGFNGLLVMTPGVGFNLSVSITKPFGVEIDFYKIAHLTGDGRVDFFAIAARKGGLIGLNVSPHSIASRSNEGHSFHAPGLDIVDICSLESPDWPRAVAALGADRSIHLCKDLAAGQHPQELRLSGLQGAAYSILGDKNHLFVLTSKYIYAFPHLASRFLQSEDLSGPILSRVLPIKAVDVYKSQGELFIILPDHVLAIPIEEVAGRLNVTGEATIKLGSEPARSNWDFTPDFDWVETSAAVA